MKTYIAICAYLLISVIILVHDRYKLLEVYEELKDKPEYRDYIDIALIIDIIVIILIQPVVSICMTIKKIINYLKTGNKGA